MAATASANTSKRRRACTEGRRGPTQQTELFGDERLGTLVGTPAWQDLPAATQAVLTSLMFLTRLVELFDAGRLQFHGNRAPLRDRSAFLRHLGPTRKKPWIVYAKPPFAGPAAVLAYLSRYTHRVAISNRRLLALDERAVTFRYKDYRRGAAERYQVMTLAADEFICRFLLHVLPRGFHRIRHYGLLASGGRRDNLARVRQLLDAPPPVSEPNEAPEPPDHRPPCPCCGGRMLILETFERYAQPRAPPRPVCSPGRSSP